MCRMKPPEAQPILARDMGALEGASMSLEDQPRPFQKVSAFS